MTNFVSPLLKLAISIGILLSSSLSLADLKCGDLFLRRHSLVKYFDNFSIQELEIVYLERVVPAEQLIKRKLNLIEWAALDKAHWVGGIGKDGNPAQVGNYTLEQNAEKARILRKAGFSKEETKMLMQAGIVGLLDAFSNYNNETLNAARRLGRGESFGEALRDASRWIEGATILTDADTALNARRNGQMLSGNYGGAFVTEVIRKGFSSRDTESEPTRSESPSYPLQGINHSAVVYQIPVESINEAKKLMENVESDQAAVDKIEKIQKADVLSAVAKVFFAKAESVEFSQALFKFIEKANIEQIKILMREALIKPQWIKNESAMLAVAQRLMDLNGHFEVVQTIALNAQVAEMPKVLDLVFSYSLGTKRLLLSFTERVMPLLSKVTAAKYVSKLLDENQKNPNGNLVAQIEAAFTNSNLKENEELIRRLLNECDQTQLLDIRSRQRSGSPNKVIEEIVNRKFFEPARAKFNEALDKLNQELELLKGMSSPIEENAAVNSISKILAFYSAAEMQVEEVDIVDSQPHKEMKVTLKKISTMLTRTEITVVGLFGFKKKVNIVKKQDGRIVPFNTWF